MSRTSYRDELRLAITAAMGSLIENRETVTEPHAYLWGYLVRDAEFSDEENDRITDEITNVYMRQFSSDSGASR